MQDPLKEQVAWITGYGSGAGQFGAIELLKATAQQILAAHTRHRFVDRPRGHDQLRKYPLPPSQDTRARMVQA